MKDVKCFFVLLKFWSIPEKARLGSTEKSISLKTKTSKPQTYPKNSLPVLLTPVIHMIYTLNVSGISPNITDLSQLSLPLADMIMFISP